MIGADCTIQGKDIRLDYIKEAVDTAHNYLTREETEMRKKMGIGIMRRIDGNEFSRLRRQDRRDERSCGGIISRKKTESTPEGTQEAQAPSGDVMTIEFFSRRGKRDRQKGYQANH